MPSAQIQLREAVEAWVDDNWDWIKETTRRPRGWQNPNGAIRYYIENPDAWERDKRRVAEERGEVMPEGFRRFLERRGRLPEQEEDGPMWDGGRDDEAGELWKRMSAKLVSQVPEAVWETWMVGIRPHLNADDMLVLGVPTPFALEWLERRMYATLEGAARECDETLQVLIRVEARDDES